MELVDVSYSVGFDIVAYRDSMGGLAGLLYKYRGPYTIVTVLLRIFPRTRGDALIGSSQDILVRAKVLV